MSAEEKAQKLLLRGLVSEAGMEKEFQEYLEQLRKTFSEIDDDDKKGAYLVAVTFFVLDQRD